MTAPSGRLSHVAAGESGFTLAELMVAGALLIVVLLAALAVFDLFGRNDKTNNTLTAAQDTARTALDQMSREQVNAQSAGSSSAVLGATPWALAFQASDPPASPAPSNSANLHVARYGRDTAAGG